MAKKNEASQMVSKYAEDWMPVKNIMNGREKRREKISTKRLNLFNAAIDC